ncbi:MAG: hypothetical protein R3244_05845 [Thermoanaerobaculia bacterium]|nr:hypothetical protein [Thermoanaerobaculia bacterium]
MSGTRKPIDRGLDWYLSSYLDWRAVPTSATIELDRAGGQWGSLENGRTTMFKKPTLTSLAKTCG